jgi:formate-nitrite transporter family protein
MLVVITALPSLEPAALTVGTEFVKAGVTMASFASAVLGGTVITLMTWMENSTDDMAAKLAAAISIAFLLAAGGLHHAVVMSLEMFAALHSHASFGYLDWLRVTGWAALGNLVGGVGLVTVLRVAQMRSELRSQQD